MLPIKYEAITDRDALHILSKSSIDPKKIANAQNAVKSKSKSYDIYFKVEDDGELLFEEPGSQDLDATIKRCNELNDSYPYDGGVFVVCSVNGNRYSDLVIEYEPK